MLSQSGGDVNALIAILQGYNSTPIVDKDGNVLIGTNTDTAGVRLKVVGGSIATDGGLSVGAAATDAADGNIEITGVIKVDGTQVVSNRVVDARADDTINTSTWDATTAGVLNAVRDAMISHGLIAAS